MSINGKRMLHASFFLEEERMNVKKQLNGPPSILLLLSGA
jgi:hypothetical protein